MADVEKIHAQHIDDASSDELAKELSARGELVTVDNGIDEHHLRELHLDLSEAEKKKILRKVDLRLIPLLTFLYLVAFIDRTNIGNAKIAGLVDDLHMKGLMYNAAVTLFFVSYTLLEVPSNIVLKLMKPSRWISILLFSWGLVMTLMGLVDSYGGLLAARFCLGIAEAGFFPAATFLLTLWYTRYEYQRRFAIFYAAASMAGAFSGLLAFAIEKMKGIGGRTGWQWIFILEGLIPVAISFVLWAVLPDSPETCRFLDKREKEFIINRIAIETGSGKGHVTNNDKITLKHIIAGLSEWKLWAFVLVYWGNSVGTYGFSATVPSVIEELGYSAANAQLLTVPIYAFAVCFVIVNAFLSDHYKIRWRFILLGYGVAACGFVAQLAIPHPKYPGVTYGFLFPVAGGMYGGFPPLISWIANNIAPSSKRAVGMALVISVGNMGAIMGSNIYLAREKPKYPTGFGGSFAMLGLAIIMVFVLRFAFLRENRKRDELIAEIGEEGVHARYTEQELVDMGDRSPFFRYAI